MSFAPSYVRHRCVPCFRCGTCLRQVVFSTWYIQFTLCDSTPTRGQGSTEKEPLGSDHTIAYHTAFTHCGFFASYLCLGRFSQHSSYTYHLCSARHPAAFLTAATICANQTEKTRVLSHSDEATLRREHRVRACPHQLRQHLDRSGASSVLVSTTTTTTRCHFSASARLPSIQQLLVATTYTYWYVPQAIHRTAPAAHRDRRPVSLSRSEFPHPLFARPSELHIAGFYGAPRSSVSSPRRTVRSRCTQSVLAAASPPSIPRLSPSSYPAFDRTLHAPPLPERPLPLVSLPNLHHDNVGPSPAGHVGPSRPTHIYFRRVGGHRTRIPQAERTAPPDASRHCEHRCFTSVHSTYTSQQIDQTHPRLDNSLAPLKTLNSRPPSALSGARRSVTHTPARSPLYL